jgi:hypothetical protein
MLTTPQTISSSQAAAKCARSFDHIVRRTLELVYRDAVYARAIMFPWLATCSSQTLRKFCAVHRGVSRFHLDVDSRYAVIDLALFSNYWGDVLVAPCESGLSATGLAGVYTDNLRLATESEADRTILSPFTREFRVPLSLYVALTIFPNTVPLCL